MKQEKNTTTKTLRHEENTKKTFVKLSAFVPSWQKTDLLKRSTTDIHYHKIKKIFFFLLFATTGTIQAQQAPHYTQYTFNMYGMNPAFASTSKCLDVKLGGRLQWLGFPGAPKTAFLSITKAFRFKKLGKGIHCFGIYVAKDETGNTGRTYVKGSYSYHKKLTRNLSGSIGFFGGLQEYSIRSGNTYDPAMGIGSAWHMPDIMPGILLYNNNFYAGFSIEQVYKMNIKQTAASELQNHYYFSAGYRMNSRRTDEHSFFASTMIQYTIQSAPSINLTLMYDYRSKVSIGGAYRIGDALSFIVKFKAMGFLTLGYAFDFPFSKMGSTFATGHELMMGFNPCTGGGDIGGMGGSDYHLCPAFK